jgi:thioesterase domain-containing protein
VRIWADVLEAGPISVHDDFFEIGGHSLKAAAMVARVADAIGTDIPLALLLENPTLSGFADALVRSSRRETSGIAAVCSEGDRPPLFFLHGDFNGRGMYCARLARGLTRQPFFAVEPFGSEAGSKAPASIEEMAARHAAAIRRVRPHGPYLLGGHCNGALEAIEIARQFRSEGEQVPAVVLIQPPAADPRLMAVDVPLRAAARLARLDEERRVDIYLRVNEALLQIAEQPYAAPVICLRKVRSLLWRKRPSTAPSDGAAAAEPSALRHDAVVWRRYTRAVAAYVPRRYDGSAGVFVAEEERARGGSGDPFPTWQRAGGPRLQFHMIPGHHLSCITTHVASTSAAIDRYVDGALHGIGSD